MADWAEDGELLKAAVLEIEGVNADFLWPDAIRAPHVVILPGPSSLATFDGQHDRVFTVFLLAAMAHDGTYRGQERCLPYMEDDGAKSVRAALEGCDDLRVITTPWHNFDALKTWAGRVFWGAICEAEVLD